MIVATRNRPTLLLEAIDSVMNQTRSPLEVIVVDDASEPPVDAEAMRSRFGPTVMVTRNPTCEGLAWGRHEGVRLASGDYVVHLDDDDLFAPNLVEICADFLDQASAMDLTFIGTRGFGAGAEHFNQVHLQGVDRILRDTAARRCAPSIFEFDERLAAALMSGVPMPFQRAMAHRATWLRINELRFEAHKVAFGLATLEDGRSTVRGTLRDSEWARYAALSGARIALIDRPLYLQRCEGQGLSSRDSAHAVHVRQLLAIGAVMHSAAGRIEELRPHRQQIRSSYVTTLSDAAYEEYSTGHYLAAMRHLTRAFSVQPQFRHWKLLARMLMTAKRPRLPRARLRND